MREKNSHHVDATRERSMKANGRVVLKVGDRKVLTNQGQLIETSINWGDASKLRGFRACVEEYGVLEDWFYIQGESTEATRLPILYVVEVIDLNDFGSLGTNYLVRMVTDEATT